MNSLLAVFRLGGGEIILMLALILILFGSRHLPNMSKGLGERIEQFSKSKHYALDPRSWLEWNPRWADLITILLVAALGMVILSLFAA